MERIRVAVVNWTNLDDDDVEEGVAALQRQVTNDFAPAWGVEAELFPVRKGTAQQFPGAWGLLLLDQTLPVAPDDTNPARYGEVSFSSGLPLTKVFVNRASRGQDWTFYASHSLLETLANPLIAGTVYHRIDKTTFRLYAREICDPCAGYSFGYECAERMVSDFVLPHYYRPGQTTELDFRHAIQTPFSVLRGGRAYFFDMNKLERKLQMLGGSGTITDAVVDELDDRLKILARCLSAATVLPIIFPTPPAIFPP